MLDLNEHNDFFKLLSQYENRMDWHINKLCNFHCEYCIASHYASEKEDPNVGRYSPGQFLEALNNTGRRWFIFIAGGEPLLYPNFIEWVNTVSPFHTLLISTNLSSKNAVAFANEVDPRGIAVLNASLHIGHHTEKSLARFIENYHLYLEKGFNIIVSYVVYPPLFKRVEADFIYMKEKGIEQMMPKSYHGLFEGKEYPLGYTSEQLEMIHKLRSLSPNERSDPLKKLKFKNKQCNAGKNYFHMDMKGDMFSCHTLMKPHGNMFDGTFKLNDEPTRCPNELCLDGDCGLLSQVDPPKMKNRNKKTLADYYQSLKETFSN
jgi:MoaA/NifB/PqqE/SkfB family radical SAM enzyme